MPKHNHGEMASDAQLFTCKRSKLWLRPDLSQATQDTHLDVTCLRIPINAHKGISELVSFLCWLESGKKHVMRTPAVLPIKACEFFKSLTLSSRSFHSARPSWSMSLPYVDLRGNCTTSKRGFGNLNDRAFLATWAPKSANECHPGWSLKVSRCPNIGSELSSSSFWPACTVGSGAHAFFTDFKGFAPCRAVLETPSTGF